MLRASKKEFKFFRCRSVRVKFLLNCYTVAAPQTQVPPCADPPSLVRYTYRPFVHRRRCTKRLTVPGMVRGGLAILQVGVVTRSRSVSAIIDSTTADGNPRAPSAVYSKFYRPPYFTVHPQKRCNMHGRQQTSLPRLQPVSGTRYADDQGLTVAAAINLTGMTYDTVCACHSW